MLFTPTVISGAYVIDVERRSDDRGYFARAWCLRELRAQGVDVCFVQSNLSHSLSKGTVRGLHYQSAPHEEAKLVWCARGTIYDVLVDLRIGSLSYGMWFGTELTEKDHRMMFVPQGCAHGYQSLTEGAEAMYLVSTYYAAETERGLRYDDPSIGIRWPLSVTNVSEKDRAWPDVRLSERTASALKGDES